MLIHKRSVDSSRKILVCFATDFGVFRALDEDKDHVFPTTPFEIVVSRLKAIKEQRMLKTFLKEYTPNLAQALNDPYTTKLSSSSTIKSKK